MGIRLVCSDLDGTLLQYGKKELEGEIFDQIRALHDRGSCFARRLEDSIPVCGSCSLRWRIAVFSYVKTVA